MPFIRDKYLPFFKLVSPTWIMFESGQFQVGTTTEFAQMQNMSRVVSYSTDFPSKIAWLTFSSPNQETHMV